MNWTRRHPRRAVGALFLAGLLASALSAHAAQPVARRPAGPEARRAAPAEALLVRLGHLLTSLWGAEGSFIDPFGHPQSGSPTQPRPTSLWGAEGSAIDPFGHPQSGSPTQQRPSQPLTDNGTIIDPLG